MTIKTGEIAAAADFIGNPADFFSIDYAATTLEVTVDGYQKILVFAKGNLANTGNETVDIDLRQEGVVKDKVVSNQSAGGDQEPFSLMYSETPAAGTYTIDVVTGSGGGLSNVKICVLKLRTGYAP